MVFHPPLILAHYRFCNTLVGSSALPRRLCCGDPDEENLCILNIDTSPMTVLAAGPRLHLPALLVHH